MRSGSTLALWGILGTMMLGFVSSVSAQDKLEDPWHILEPFWKSKTVYGESLFFVQADEKGRPRANLIFKPEKILSLKSATGLVTYEEGRDYALSADKAGVILPEGSRIPFKKQSELYLPKGSPRAIQRKIDDPNIWLYFSEGHFFHDQQAQVTYTHKDKWTGYMPKYAGDALPRTMKKLKAGEPLKLYVTGDSISCGCNASKSTKAEPFQPRYQNLLVDMLGKVYKSKIIYKNFSGGGWTAKWGLQEAAARTAEAKPDLVIIAYGMNDAGAKRTQASYPYKTHIEAIMKTVQEINPEVEFILVAPMLGNPEWWPTPSEVFSLMRDDLKWLCGKGVVLADMTSMWQGLLKIKRYQDLTGNGVNHPNDFSHRIYAQVLLSLLRQQ